VEAKVVATDTTGTTGQQAPGAQDPIVPPAAPIAAAVSSHTNNSHPGASAADYAELKAIYIGPYSAPERSSDKLIFEDALLSCHLIHQRGTKYRNSSTDDLRDQLTVLLKDTPQAERQYNFTCEFFALTRELYYSTTNTYPSDEEMLGVLMLCDPNATQITRTKHAKLLTGHTALSNNTQAMLALVAAFKAITTQLGRIDIVMGDDEDSWSSSEAHTDFFRALGIASGTLEETSNEPNIRVVFTTFEDLAREAAHSSPALVPSNNRLALIDGDSVSFAQSLALPVDISSCKRPSLHHIAQKYFLDHEDPTADDFFSLNPTFNHLPKRFIDLCLRLVPSMLHPTRYNRINRAENLYLADLILKYSSVIHLTKSSPTPGDTVFFDKIFGEQRLERTLPGSAIDSSAEYTVTLVNSADQRFETVISKARSVKSQQSKQLVIVTEHPDKLSLALSRQGIPNIGPNKSHPKDYPDTNIFVCHTSTREVFSFASQEGKAPVTLEVIIASNVSDPGQLQTLKQIGPRSGVPSTTSHIVVMHEFDGLPVEETLLKLSENDPKVLESDTLKRCVSFIRDAESIARYTSYALRAEKIGLIKETLVEYSRGDGQTAPAPSEFAGIAEAILKELTQKNTNALVSRSAEIEIPDFAAAAFIDPHQHPEIFELCAVFEENLGIGIRDIHRYLQDNQPSEPEDDGAVLDYDRYTYEAMHGAHLQQYREYSYLACLFQLCALKIASEKQALSSIAAYDVLQLLRPAAEP
jgi:hypothetical protein